ncbi:expressed tetratricopeptide repeat protein [Nitzschia inconspicua]|uniref:Expressed tetratricopeptide repeat protein n=1 Tax=Nitzschia inconspicua TaxID=303405 RepID=A0A9K3PX05_9STRA|nr:expressed tetratricopeptide repeat protein [Nitzschia inconspicua]
MYSASRITPVQRMRRQSSSLSSTRAVSPGKKSSSSRRNLSNDNGASSSSLGIIKTNNGDYQVLKNNVDRDRKAVQDARMVLATSLDQLGEHHVRQKEYDDAMDAFTEALREKRSVFWHMSHHQNPIGTSHSRGSSVNSSFLSGTTASTSAGGVDDDSTTFSNKDPAGQDAINTIHDEAIDELVITLKSMGNVHSLRGEQDEAMRYFTEVTSLRAQKKCNMAIHASNTGCDDSHSFLSGINDESSALMSEINEDVKALDDLFRSISFRNIATNGSNKAGISSTSLCGPEKRKSKSGSLSNKKHKGDSMQRQYVSSPHSTTHIVENEPFDRSAAVGSAFSLTSSSNLQSGLKGIANEASEAMDMYKNAIDTYAGPESRAEKHNEMFNSLALRVELLSENRRTSMSKTDGFTPISSSSSATAVAESLYSNPESAAKAMSTKAADLELALEIYKHVLMAHEESRASSGLGLCSSIESNNSFGSSETAPSASSNFFPGTDIEGNIQNSQLSTNNGIELKQQQQQQQQQIASNIASSLICMGSVYYKLGNRVEELRMYQDAKRVYRKAFGENHVFVAGTRKNIGMVLAERGEYDEAMKQFEKAMKIYLAVNNNRDHDIDGAARHSNMAAGLIGDSNMLNRDVASAISCMGNVKNRTGELDAALLKYMQALQIYKSLYHLSLSESDSSYSPATTEALRDVTATLKVIGMVHAKKGDLDSAMKFFQEAMALLRTIEITSAAIVGSASAGGADEASNPQISFAAEAEAVVCETTASVLTRIASIHLKRGDLDAAMSHYREAYNLTIRNRGTTNHPEVAGILHYIGGIYHKRADYDEAMSCYQEAIRIYHSTLGPGNPTVAGTLVMVGSIHYKRRHLDSAMMFYREALRLNRDAYGMHHPDVAPILKSIGTILTKKGDYEDAYDIFRDVLSIKCTIHGTDHPEVASAYKSLGNVHYKLGDLADAERQYRHALSIYRRCKGEDHPDTVAAKTTIDHLRYWMKERDQRRHMESRQSHGSGRRSSGIEADDMNDERSC